MMQSDFQAWLAIATKGLAPDVERRVRSELTAHYDDALQSYQAQGMSLVDARQAALDDLGDPRLTARALHRSYGRAKPILRQGRLAFMKPFTALNSSTLLLVIAALGWVFYGAIVHQNAGDMGHPTFEALMLQTALLTLALSLPLFFGELDLSLGVVTMLGVLLARPPEWSGPVDLHAALITAALLGAGIGLLHGALVVLLRRPAAPITAVSGMALLLLAPNWSTRPYQGFAIDTGMRLTLYAPTVKLFAVVVALTFVVALIARLLRRPSPPGPAHGQPHRGWAPFKFLLGGLGLLVCAAGISLLLDDPHAIVALLASSCLAAIAVARNKRTRAWINRLLYTLTAQPVAQWTGVLREAPGYDRLRRAVSLRSGRVQPAVALARILALMTCSTLGAIVGVMMCAQGIRDNTYAPLTLYLIIVPLAGLIVGGQHVLHGWQRPIGLVLGALATAAICLDSTQPSDNLAPGAWFAILLGVIFANAWRKVLRRASASTGRPDASPDDSRRALYIA